jgi:undecaprenyl-diphosphooligosaccharide---protein glycotransferase
LGLLCALAVTVFAAATRLAELSAWRAASEIYFVDNRPVMTTADAYHSLRFAQKYLDGSFQPNADDPLRLLQRLRFPREVSPAWPGEATRDWQPQRQQRHLLLLSRLIALATPLAGSVELAALYLTPVLAALFVLPLYGYFARLGAPAAGLLGALVAAFAPVYVARTSLGDVDTDCLNLFFPWLAAWVLICIRPQASAARVIGLAAVLGVVLFGYYRWYDKPALSMLYWGALALVLLVQRRPLMLVVAASSVCIVACHPDQAALCVRDLTDLLSRYVGGGNPADGESAASAWFPNVMNTVGEFRAQDLRASLDEVLAPTALAVLGLGVFVVFACRRWRDCIPLLPLLAMASFTFTGGGRFAIYLAPFIGVGLGIALSWILRAVLARTVGASRGRDTAITMVAAILLFGLCLQPLTAPHTIRRPVAVPAELQRALHDAAARMPAGAPVWTWWDYGYALAHLVGFSVYHDGGAQYTPQTNLIAWSFMTDDQAALSRTMDFVDREGNRGIDALARKAGSREALLAALAAEPAPGLPRRPKYLLFTASMVDAASALRYAAGLPTELPDGSSTWFEPLPCQDLKGRTLHCDGYDIDLGTGLGGDGRPVRRFVIIDGGQVVKALDYDNGAEAVLELVIDANRQIRVYRVPDPVYASNLNRLFVLGEYDAALFEEVAQRPGLMRMFRQKF